MSDERREIEEAQRDATITVAARRLGVARRTLQNRMRRYGMPRGRAGRPPKKLKRRRTVARVATIGAVALGALLLVRATQRAPRVV